MKKVFFLLLTVIYRLMSYAAPTLFRLPPTAYVAERSKDGKGWLEQGIVSVTFVQAEGQFRSSLARNGWRFLHAIPLAGHGGRTLYTWKRGSQELTLMLWRIDVGRTGFSWGVSKSGK